MTLDDLKKSVQIELDMDEVYDALKVAYADNDNYVTFRRSEESNPNSRYEINHVQADLLREKGYTVEWNSPCGWWEVSGWKE